MVRSKLALFTTLLLFALTSFTILNSRLSAQVLPESLQACFDLGQCSDLQQIAEVETASVYSYLVDGDLHALFRYNIVTPSSTVFESDSADHFASHRGSTWLSVATQYDLSASIRMTLYAEQTSNAIQGDSGGPFLDQDVGLEFTGDALLAGTGTFAGDAEGTLDDDSMLLDFPAFCLGDGCYLSATLTLLNMDWQQSGDVALLGIDLDDNRQTLFSQFRSYPGADASDPGAFVENTSFIVGVVPEPSSIVVLFGVLGTVVVRRRRSV